MMKTLLIFFISAGIVSALFFVAFGLLNLKAQQNAKRYDLLTDFPYDFSFGQNPFSLFSRVFFVAFALSVAFLPLGLVMGDYPGVSSMGIFLMASLFFLAGAGSGVVFVSSMKTKPHLVSAFAFLLIGGLCSFFAGLLFFQFRNDYPGIGWTFAILLWVVAFLFILLAINPRLANWAKMNVVESVDGSYLEKPRPFWLAFTEWLSFILYGVLFVLVSSAFICIALV